MCGTICSEAGSHAHPPPSSLFLFPKDPGLFKIGGPALAYLQAQNGTAVTPREVERLYVQVNKFALVSAGGREGGAGRRTHPQLLALTAL